MIKLIDLIKENSTSSYDYGCVMLYFDFPYLSKLQNAIDSKDSEIFSKEDKIKPNWKPYLFDVAFQKHVIEKANPEFKVTPYLMLADKSKSTSIEGLNQLFRVVKNAGDRTGIIKKIQKLDNIETDSVLTEIKVTHEISLIEEDKERLLKEYSFYESI